VLPRIQQHVRDRVANLARSAEDLEVIAVAQHLPTTAGDSIHRSRKSRTERLHAAREISHARRFNDQVHVIRLKRVVNDTESPAVATLAERALELADETYRAERRDVSSDAQRDVAGMARGERRSKRMRVAAEQPRLAARTVAAPTPLRRCGERKRELSRATSHRQHDHANK
jgi:hypothetical protein